MLQSEMMERMPASEFVEWMAYYRMEPFGEVRADLRGAKIEATLANIHRDPDQRSEPFSVSDFMPRFEQVAAPVQDPAGMQQLMMMLKRAQDKHLEARGMVKRVRRS